VSRAVFRGGVRKVVPGKMRPMHASARTDAMRRLPHAISINEHHPMHVRGLTLTFALGNAFSEPAQPVLADLHRRP
jgi:hypothetical protein